MYNVINHNYSVISSLIGSTTITAVLCSSQNNHMHCEEGMMWITGATLTLANDYQCRQTTKVFTNDAIIKVICNNCFNKTQCSFSAIKQSWQSIVTYTCRNPGWYSITNTFKLLTLIEVVHNTLVLS